MKYFFSPSTGGLYLDGIHSTIPDDAIEITKEQHASVQTGQNDGMGPTVEDGKFVMKPFRDLQSLEGARISAISIIDVEMKNELASLTDGYSADEKELFAVQLEEAKAYRADPKADTPVIDALLNGRDKEEVISKIITKNTNATVTKAKAVARRNMLVNRINECETVAEVNAITWEGSDE